MPPASAARRAAAAASGVTVATIVAVAGRQGHRLPRARGHHQPRGQGRVQGGRRFSFTALVVVGDGNGMVGVGYGKAKEVPAAIAKGVEAAKKGFFRVPRIAGTIPHTVQGEEAAGVVLLKPASPGTGVIAGGPVRAVLECAGIHDVLSRSLGSSNPINVVHATVAALKGLSRPEEIAARRGLPIEHVAPAAMLRARAAATSASPGHARRQQLSGSKTMAELKVTQTKSKIGGNQAQRDSLRSLGLHRIGDVVVKARPARDPRHDPGGAPPGGRGGG